MFSSFILLAVAVVPGGLTSLLYQRVASAFRLFVGLIAGLVVLVFPVAFIWLPPDVLLGVGLVESVVGLLVVLLPASVFLSLLLENLWFISPICFLVGVLRHISVDDLLHDFLDYLFHRDGHFDFLDALYEDGLLVLIVGFLQFLQGINKHRPLENVRLFYLENVAHLPQDFVAILKRRFALLLRPALLATGEWRGGGGRGEGLGLCGGGLLETDVGLEEEDFCLEGGDDLLLFEEDFLEVEAGRVLLAARPQVPDLRVEALLAFLHTPQINNESAPHPPPATITVFSFLVTAGCRADKISIKCKTIPQSGLTPRQHPRSPNSQGGR